MKVRTVIGLGATSACILFLPFVALDRLSPLLASGAFVGFGAAMLTVVNLGYRHADGRWPWRKNDR